MFVEKANLPIKKVDISVVAGNAKNVQLKNCIYTEKCLDVYDEIAFHPDIQMMHMGEDMIVIALNMYEQYAKIFTDLGMKVIRGSTEISKKYPYDIAYNGAYIDKYFIHNLDYTDKKVLDILEQRNISLINVKQGYSKCNICVVDSTSVITSDKGIASALQNYFNVLYIDTKNIFLSDTMTGFIGGATGLIDKNVIYLNGRINCLDKNTVKMIESFLDERKISLMCNDTEKIYDIGTVIPLKYE